MSRDSQLADLRAPAPDGQLVCLEAGPHACEARIFAHCRRCGARVELCSADQATVALILSRRYRCPPCRGGRPSRPGACRSDAAGQRRPRRRPADGGLMTTTASRLKLRAEIPEEQPVHSRDVVIATAEGWGETVAVVRGAWLSPEEVAERARLLAAAPELLEAVELALWLMDRVAGWDVSGEPITKFAAQYHGQQFRDAIARTKGGAA